MYGENLNALNPNVMSKFHELHLWCVRNKLTIDCDKTIFILVHGINKPVMKQLDEIVISDMKSFQCLGLTPDKTLQFNELIEFGVKSLIEYFVLWFVNDIMMKICSRSFELYFQKDIMHMMFKVKINWQSILLDCASMKKLSGWHVLHCGINYIKTWYSMDW